MKSSIKWVYIQLHFSLATSLGIKYIYKILCGPFGSCKRKKNPQG